MKSINTYISETLKYDISYYTINESILTREEVNKYVAIYQKGASNSNNSNLSVEKIENNREEQIKNLNSWFRDELHKIVKNGNDKEERENLRSEFDKKLKEIINKAFDDNHKIQKIMADQDKTEDMSDDYHKGSLAVPLFNISCSINYLTKINKEVFGTNITYEELQKRCQEYIDIIWDEVDNLKDLYKDISKEDRIFMSNVIHAYELKGILKFDTKTGELIDLDIKKLREKIFEGVYKTTDETKIEKELKDNNIKTNNPAEAVAKKYKGEVRDIMSMTGLSNDVYDEINKKLKGLLGIGESLVDEGKADDAREFIKNNFKDENGQAALMVLLMGYEGMKNIAKVNPDKIRAFLSGYERASKESKK